MAKIKHNNFLDTVDEVITNATNAGVIHLHAEGNELNGRRITVNGKSLYHFGTTGYLGLEQDKRLKKAAINAIQKYGTQFPLSKTYISHPLYAPLEEKIFKMYEHPILITKNSTLGHLAVIPTAVREGDAVILDHQVHWSVQSATEVLKSKGVTVRMIRHSNMEMLEHHIKDLRNKVNKIWYMADGVYSMYGDFAPLQDLMELSQKYPQLHLYIDDVHGMSWRGKHGSGYVMSVLKELPQNILLFGTLSKTFGASGAVLICPNEKLHSKIKNFGGPLTFSVQLEPATVGAAIASAKIHLSEEIYKMQDELYDRITYFNQCLQKTNLPLIIENDSPIFYIGAGMPETGFNLVNRLIETGFYVNLGMFPAVPVKNTGLRITISRHNQKQEIKALVEALEYHFPKALEETHTNLDRVNFAFGRGNNRIPLTAQSRSNLTIETYNSIKQIDPKLWNVTVGGNSFYDWNGLKALEGIFRDNGSPENNYQFYYYVVKNDKHECILATFFSYGLWKEDMLAPESVSVKLEKMRESEPYYHTSYCLSMGSMITEGEHLYLCQDRSDWKEAFKLLLEQLELLEKKLKPQYVILRDFNPGDNSIKTFLHNKGFVQVAMPEAAIYDQFNWNDEASYIETLSKSSRKHFRKDIEAFKDKFEIQILDKLTDSELEKSFELYQQVKKNNLGLNTFSYPLSLFKHMNLSSQWEYILLYLKEEKMLQVGVMFCYKNSNNIYTPAIIGMDYKFSREYNVYRQLLFQTILRANELGHKRIDFGLTAGFEKRKVGAKVIEKCAYIQTRDNFTLEALDWLRKD